MRHKKVLACSLAFGNMMSDKSMNVQCSAARADCRHISFFSALAFRRLLCLSVAVFSFALIQEFLITHSRGTRNIKINYCPVLNRDSFAWTLICWNSILVRVTKAFGSGCRFVVIVVVFLFFSRCSLIFSASFCCCRGSQPNEIRYSYCCL